jgi:hypothetical protein
MTITLADLRRGDVIFPSIHGYAGALVGAGQVILGDAGPREWKVRHVAMVTAAAVETTGRAAPMGDLLNLAGQLYTLPLIAQAMPGGAEEVPLTPASFAEGFPILRPMLDNSQGVEMAQAARRYIGVPYSFLDYAAIAGRHLLALQPTQRTPFDRYVTSTKHMICSQLVDQALTDADYHLFNDGRLPQDVTPAALYRKLLTMPGTVRLR